ncbi:MAG TPA: DUF423 domain-containing protein [Alphaproteobacteria bacterium]|jgi:uncharacterized membrane protein YgdD (TMEM256/DUF423 family)|nr:DUF423 domain-containing protein [Alphaproteobacteria bacterium]
MRTWIAVAALFGLAAVALGAFGAHGLKSRASAEQLAWLETATRYAMWHALALLGVAALGETAAGAAAGTLRWVAWSFAIGIVVFSGSLTLMALGGPRWLGATTPFGGGAFLFGWASLVVYALWR